jgi:dipeptidyl aminopeptidase/acylaminoacyl peptidase
VFYFEHDGARNAADIWMVSLDAGAKPEALFAQPTLNETDPAISPDGRWLAYVTNETGTDQVYLTDFPGMARRWQVSDGGGNHPAWHPGGRELFFTGASVAEPFTLWSVALTPEAPDPPERPRLLFESPDIFTQLVGTPYDVAPDGGRFLILRKRPVDRTAIARLTVVANWLGEVRAQVR